MNTLSIAPTAQIAQIAQITQAPSVRVPAVRRSEGAAPQTGSVRLTRRGRLVVLVLALAFVLAVGVALGGVSVASEDAEPQATRVVVVDEGDTLWGIASEVADDGEVREMVSEIRNLNALDSAVITLGQKIHVPVAE